MFDKQRSMRSRNIVLGFRVVQEIIGRPCPRQDSGDYGSGRLRRSGWLRVARLVVLVLDSVTPAGAASRRALHGAPRGTSGLVQAVLLVLLMARCEGEAEMRKRVRNIRRVRSGRRSGTATSSCYFLSLACRVAGEMRVTFAERIYTFVSTAIAPLA